MNKFMEISILVMGNQCVVGY